MRSVHIPCSPSNVVAVVVAVVVAGVVKTTTVPDTTTVRQEKRVVGVAGRTRAVRRRERVGTDLAGCSTSAGWRGEKKGVGLFAASLFSASAGAPVERVVPRDQRRIKKAIP